MSAPSPLDTIGGQVVFAIKVDGKEINNRFQIFSVDVWLAVNKVPRAQVVLFDGSPAERDFPLSNMNTFLPGAKVEIEAGYDKRAKSILFSGIIVKHGIEITGAQASKLCLDLADPAVEMTLARKNAVFEKKKDSEIIETLCNASGLDKDIASTTTQHERVVQFYATDWDMMVTRADANGLVIVVAGGKVSVQRPDTAQKAALRVVYGESIFDLRAEMDASLQYKSSAFKVHAWDAATQSVVDASPAALPMTEAGNYNSDKLAAVFNIATNPRQTGALVGKEDLAVWASAELSRSKLAKIRGHVRFYGDGRAKVGKTIQLDGLGKRFNGPLFIGGVHHGIHNGAWMTTVTFGLSPQPFAVEAPRIAAPDASGQLPPVKGLQTGVVKQVSKDDTGEYRVLVKLPLLQDETGVWARLGTFYASNQAGAVFFPEIGDEVVVGFMNEDPRYPVILGSVYSKARKPPMEPNEENTLKGIVTREKLKITFDEKDKIIQVVTPGGHNIKMDDKDGSITIADSNENVVKLSKDGVNIDSAKDIKLSAKGDVTIGATGSLNLSAQRDVSMEGLNVSHKAKAKLSAEGNASAEFTASGEVTIRGAMVMIN